MKGKTKIVKENAVTRTQRKLAGHARVAKSMLAVLLLAVLVGVAYRVWGPPGIVSLTIDDADTLKDVFYGGQPWLVVCHNNNTGGNNRKAVLVRVQYWCWWGGTRGS